METNSTATASLTTANGRPIKFTPERLEQIKNLVERGMSREQIAETIGVTVGSLQVTCSRVGISLRRRQGNNGVAPAPRKMPKPRPEPKLAVRMRYQNRERLIELPLASDTIGRLAIEAHFLNLSVGQMTVQLIMAAIKADMFDQIEPGGQ
jgi:hypothetical protein